jgi:murein DD-endopeptidase MepM/ murein hydrolase activator NlpD
MTLGKATFTVELDLSSYRAGLAQLAGITREELGKTQGQAREAGRASGTAFGAGLSQSAPVSRFSQALQSELNKSANAFKAAGDTGIAGFANSIRSGGASVSTAMAGVVSGAAPSTAAAMSGAGQTAGSAFNRALTQTSLAIAGIFSNAAAAAGTGAGGALVRSFGEAASSNHFFKIGVSAGNGMKSAFKAAGDSIAQQLKFQISNALIGIGASLFNTKNFGEFDKAARLVETIAPRQRQQYERASQTQSRQLGYSVTSKELLEGKYQILSGGYSGNRQSDIDALSIAAAKVKAVSGDNAKLEDTAGAIASLGNVFKDIGIKAQGRPINFTKEADQLAGLITGFVDASKGFQEGLTSRQIGKLVQPAANSRIGAADALAFAAAASQTLTPGDVVAGQPQFFKKIQKRSKEANAVATQLGYNQSDPNSTDGFNNTALIAKGLPAFVEDLSKKAAAYEAKNGLGARNEALTKLFGDVRAARFTDAVLARPEAVKEAKGTIEGSNIDQKFAIVQAGLIAKQQAFKNSLVELDVQIKQGAVGSVLTTAFGVAASAVGVLSAGLNNLNKWFVSLDDGTKNVIQGFGAFAVGVAGVVAGVVAAGAAWAVLGGALTAGIALLGGIASGFATLAVALAPVVIPLAAIGAGVYAIAKAFGATNTQAFTAALVAVGIGLAALFGPAALGAISAGVAAIVSAFGAIAVAAGTALIPLLPWIAAAAGIAAALYLLKVAYDNNKEAIDSWFQGVIVSVTPAFEAIKGFAVGAGQAIANFANAAGPVIVSIGKAIYDFGVGVFNALKPVAEWVGQYLGASFNLASAVIGKAIEGLVADFKLKAAIIIGSVQVVAAGIGWLADRAKEGFELVKAGLQRLADGFGAAKDAIGSSMQSIGQSVTTNLARARQQFPPLDNSLKSADLWFRAFSINTEANMQRGRQAIEWFANGTRSALNGIGDVIKAISNAFLDLPNAINRAAEAIRGFQAPASKGFGNFNLPKITIPGFSAVPKSGVADIATSGGGGESYGGGFVAGLAIANQARKGLRAGLLAEAPGQAGIGVSSPISTRTLQEAINPRFDNPSLERYGADRLRRGRLVKGDHRGTDYNAPVGTPTLAAFDGSAKVLFEDRTGVAVRLERIMSDGTRIQADYLHLGRQTYNLFANGQARQVRAGETIGYVGTEGARYRDGTVTGSQTHLHFQTKVNRTTQDSTKVLADIANGKYGPVNTDSSYVPGITSPAEKPREVIPYREIITNPLRRPDRDTVPTNPVLSSPQPPPPRAAGTIVNPLGQTAFEPITVAPVAIEVAPTPAPVPTPAAAVPAVEPVTNQVEEVTKNSKELQRQIAAAEANLAAALKDQRLVMANKKTAKNKRTILAVGERVRKAKLRLENLKAKRSTATGKDEAATQKAGDSARQAEIDKVSQEIDQINSQVAEVNSQIDRSVADGGATVREGQVAKANVAVQQAEELDAILPKIAALKKKYNDSESQKTLQGLTTNINASQTAALNTATELARLPLSDLSTEVDTLISNAKAANAEADSSATRDPSRASAVAVEKADRLEALQQDLAAASAQIDKFALAFVDPDSIKALDALRSKVREVGDEAFAARKAANLTQVSDLTTQSSRVLAVADRRTQSVNISALQGDIDAPKKEEALLFVRRLAAQQLDEILPKLQAIRDAATDPAIIEAANEQIAKILQYRAEVKASVAAQEELRRSQTLQGQVAKASQTAINESWADFRKSVLAGARDLNGVLDNLFSRLADAAIGSIFDSVTSGFGIGSIFGFKDGGTVRGYAAGGEVGAGIGSGVSLLAGIAKAKAKEGPLAEVIVASRGEEVLNLRDAAIYRRMREDGTVARAEAIYGYLGGGTVGQAPGTRSAASVGGGASSSPMSVIVDRINSIDYVSVDQLQGILAIQLPLAAQAGAAITEQNIKSTGWRQSHGIR